MVRQIKSSAVPPLHFHLVILTKMILHSKTVFNINSIKNPNNSIDLEGSNLMPSFDKKSLKEGTIKSTPANKCSTSYYVK